MRFLSAALALSGVCAVSAQYYGLGSTSQSYGMSGSTYPTALPVSSGVASMAVDQSGLAPLTQQLKDFRVAEPIYTTPLTNKHYITQPIVEPKLVHQPIVQRQTVKQPILRVHHVQQPVIRPVYMQPVIRPKVIRTTQVQPELTQQPSLQPHFYDQTVIQPVLNEQFEQKEARVEQPTYRELPAETLQQTEQTDQTELKQPMLTQLPVVRNPMQGQFSQPITEQSTNQAIYQPQQDVSNAAIYQQLPTVTQQAISKNHQPSFAYAGQQMQMGQF